MQGINFQDQILKGYIDSIFDKYDTDRNGTLDYQELTFFFNDLFKQLKINMTVNQQQAIQAIKSIDQNSDGVVDKNELFLAFKKLLNPPQQPQIHPNYNYGYQPNYNPGYNQPPPYYNQHNQYPQNQGYMANSGYSQSNYPNYGSYPNYPPHPNYPPPNYQNSYYPPQNYNGYQPQR